MGKPLRIAVIGNGRWGKNIIKTLNTLSECIVLYTVTHDYAFLLKKDDIDAVVIATPPKTHTAIALKFLARKIPLFIEKPITTNLSDARRIAAASKKTKTSVFVGHLDLYNPAYGAVHTALRKIGTIHTLTSEGMSMGPFRCDVSVLWDWAPHNCAMILDIMGVMPTTVQAFGTSVLNPKTSLFDITNIQLTFKNGCVAYIYNSRLSPKKKRSLTIVGTKGTLVYSDTESDKAILTIHPITKKKAVAPTAPHIVLTYDDTPSLTAELQAFLKSVRSRKAPKTDVANGVAVVSILESAEKSIKVGGTRIRVG